MPVLEHSVENIYRVLEHYSGLKDNWNGCSAFAPSTEAIKNANNFWELILEKEIDLPSVYLEDDGEINFLWKNNNNVKYFEIGFLGAGFSCFAVDENEQETMIDSESYAREDVQCVLKILLPQVKAMF
tara:strand:+ start:777 stop:1160 length:384 start_codon:yes stop_codon:yes gene_type:complete